MTTRTGGPVPSALTLGSAVGGGDGATVDNALGAAASRHQRAPSIPRHRAGELAPWASSLLQVVEHGRIVQGSVNRLRCVGMQNLVQNCIEAGAGPVRCRRSCVPGVTGSPSIATSAHE